MVLNLNEIEEAEHEHDPQYFFSRQFDSSPKNEDTKVCQVDYFIWLIDSDTL